MRYVQFKLPEKSRSLINPQLSPSGDKQITIILDSPAKESLKEEMGTTGGGECSAWQKFIKEEGRDLGEL